jgi:hypothetical protein
MAHLEAASVPAFQRLAVELRVHGAPSQLVTRALQSAGDERRHATVVGGLARRFGGQIAPVEIDAVHVRPMFLMAAENASEGCARETYGALTAAWMANAAADSGVQNAFASIAIDELRHAELSWDIAEWSGLPSSHYESAMESLGSEAEIEPPLEVRDIAGLPSAQQAVQLWRELRG